VYTEGAWIHLLEESKVTYNLFYLLLMKYVPSHGKKKKESKDISLHESNFSDLRNKHLVSLLHQQMI